MRAVDRTLTRSYLAIPASIPEARGALADLAIAAGACPQTADDVRLAASEALTNVVLHAYPEAPGALHVTAAVAATELWMLIADDGCGLESRSQRSGLGLGLALIAQVADDFTVRPRATRGVELQMRFDLARRVPAQDRGSIVSARSPASPRFSTTM
jgi:anti-sigma regulatory factor (Ser/Thr protein kinase)